MIQYGRQDISEDDVQAVINVLRSDFLTQGPTIPQFEKTVADYCHARYGIAVNSATSALHLACLSLDVGPDDWVWTTPITFVASANCALYCGAKIDFVDIDPLTYNLSTDSLSEKLAIAEKEGRLPKVIIPVHLCGQPADMLGIYALSQRYGFKIIEDASHAIGGRYKGETIGNCRYSDITIFSFHPVKIITAGEGGMALTNNPCLAKRITLLRSHGITNNTADMMPHKSDELWFYQQIALGFNYRMTDIHAALGLSQMQRLDEFVAKRHAIAHRYNELLTDLPITKPHQHIDSFSAFHLYTIRLNLRDTNQTQRKIVETLRAMAIMVNLHYIPIYRHPYYQQLGFETGYCPKAEQYYTEAITLPLYPTLTTSQQDHVINALHSILKQ